MIVEAETDQLVHARGDAEDPVVEETLCTRACTCPVWRPYLRDAMLSVNDGLLTVCGTILMLATSGAQYSTSDIFLAAVAVALSGALSMGLGEYQATKTQAQLYDDRINIFLSNLSADKHFYRRTVCVTLQSFHLPPETAGLVADAMANRGGTLEFLKMSQLGVVEEETRKPWVAALFSFVFFVLGSIPVILPTIFFSDVQRALYAACSAFAVIVMWIGAFKSFIVGQSVWRGALENFVLDAICAFVSWACGESIAALTRI